MPLHGISRLGYVHARVTDLAQAKSHYGNTMGLYPMHETDDRLYFKGWDEWDHHSVVLESGGVGAVKFGWKVNDPGDIDGIEKAAQAFGVTVERMSAGENLETSDGIRMITPSEHVFEIYHTMKTVGVEVGSHNPEVFPRHLVGLGAPRIDHALITADDVNQMDRFLHDVFGFYATERVVTSLDDDAMYIGTWMSAGNTVHDLAVIKGPQGKLHHFAFSLVSWSDILQGRPVVRDGRRADRRRPDPARHHARGDDLLLRPLGQPQRGVLRRLRGLPGPPHGELDAGAAGQGHLLHPA